MNNEPKHFDAFLLACFVVLITFQPTLFHHEIIMMETGIHLPSISALFNGAVPYRDFFYLRGPFELYVPAFLIKTFGGSMSLLPIFYYVGSVATLIIGVLLAHQIFRTRLMFYLFVPVLIARTFPRISFYYWGGMRYALGLLALYCVVRCFKSRRLVWMVVAGVVSCLALLTTIETGVTTIAAVGVALSCSFLLKTIDRRFIGKLISAYMSGLLVLLIPYMVYLSLSHSLIPYIETTYTIVTQMMHIFVDARGNRPETFLGFFKGLIPNSPYFKFMTPIYCYVAFLFYCIWRKRKNTFNEEVSSLIMIAVYSIILYIAAFRKIQGHHFDMALQPEKILLFFILEECYLFLSAIRSKDIEKVKVSLSSGWQYVLARKRIYVINFLIIALIGSSWGYAISRYSKRFVIVKLLVNQLRGINDRDLSLLQGIDKRAVNIKRAQGMVVPTWQAKEMEEIVGFLEEHTDSQEAVFAYPELGNFNFWANRPFVGRFPIATFSWLKEEWHKELVADFKKQAPRYVIMTNLGHRTFPEEWYFRNKANIRKFNEVTQLIQDHYVLIKPYETVSVYERR